MSTDPDSSNLDGVQARQQQAAQLAQTCPWDGTTIYRLLEHLDDEPELTDYVLRCAAAWQHPDPVVFYDRLLTDSDS